VVTAKLVSAGHRIVGRPPPYTFQTVSFTGDTFTELLGINDASKIVGFHGAATNLSFTLDLPSTFTPITITGVKTPPANTVTLVPTQTDAVGINNADQVVGFVTDNVPVMSGGTTLAAGTTRGFIDNGNVFSLIVAPGTDNDVGQIVGYSSLDPAGMTLQLAYVYNEITKTFDFLDNATHTATLPANVNSQATGIDNAGDVVGFFMPTTTTSDGFLFSGGKLTTLQFPGSTFSQALGINNKGQVVGFYTMTPLALHTASSIAMGSTLRLTYPVRLPPRSTGSMTLIRSSGSILRVPPRMASSRRCRSRALSTRPMGWRGSRR
jgi:hypothetical protein